MPKTTTPHTPGPWRLEHPERDWSVDSDTAPGTVAVTICADNRIDPVCIVVEPMSHGDEKRLDGNAHLIAASPDLYEALKDCVQALSHTEAGPRIDAARAALAKAEGQS